MDSLGYRPHPNDILGRTWANDVKDEDRALALEMVPDVAVPGPKYMQGLMSTCLPIDC